VKQVEDVPESPFCGNPLLPLMLDGLALDVHGNVYVAVPTRAAIVRINARDRSQETVAVFPQLPVLDAPLSLAFGTGKGERTSLFISNGGFSGLFVPGVPWAGPGLVKINVGIPGLPLP
jgi:sugar lactone lactonase YvrE